MSSLIAMHLSRWHLHLLRTSYACKLLILGWVGVVVAARTTMLVSRYRPILYMQYLLLFVDLFMNVASDLLRFQNVILLVLYVWVYFST